MPAPESAATGRLRVAAFVVAIALAAFLLFLVQPMVGKRILPWFGGTAGVWAVCLAFYQTALFAGYLYTHLLVRFVPVRRQALVHGFVLAAAVLGPSVLPTDYVPPHAETEPIGEILGMLARHVTLPFVALASTGPLVQAWFARAFPGRSPYALYAVSNGGSFLALFAYPLLIETRLGLAAQAAWWTAGLAAAAVAVLSTGEIMRRSVESATALDGTDGLAAPVTFEEADRPDATPGHMLLWLGLAAAAVVVLNGTTNRLCLDVASVPFLWVLPLATYLLTFILCFASDGLYRRSWAFGTVTVCLAISAYQWLFGAPSSETASKWGETSVFQSIVPDVAYHLILLLALVSILHGELYRTRPRASGLTLFYLCLSAGGALGGIGVGIVAPAVFSGYTEFGLGIVVGLALAIAAIAWHEGVAAFAPPLRVGAAALVGLALLNLALLERSSPDQLLKERNFFGVLRVLDANPDAPEASRILLHGSTVHGAQFQDPRARMRPTVYFGAGSSLAAAFGSFDRSRPIEVGVVGLGIGTIASYLRSRDRMVYYEIDPAVIRVAEDPSLFTYLSGARGQVETRLGDARLLLAREQAESGSQAYDLLIIDAFSSDAIPMHLLTREAFEIYERAIVEGGLLAIHVSNRHLELGPLVSRIGQAVGLDAMLASTAPIDALSTGASIWVYLARDRDRLIAVGRAATRIRQRHGLPETVHGFFFPDPAVLAATPLWTDDSSNLLDALGIGRPREKGR